MKIKSLSMAFYRLEFLQNFIPRNWLFPNLLKVCDFLINVIRCEFT